MKTLAELLEALATLLGVDRTEFTVDDARDHIAAINVAAGELASHPDADDTALVALEGAADEVEAITLEISAAIEIDEAQTARAQAALDRIAAANSDEGPDGGEPVEGEPVVEPVEGEPVEGEPVAPVEGEPVVEPVEGAAPVPVAVAASAAPSRVIVGNARRPKAAQPIVQSFDPDKLSLVASANVPSVQAGSALDTIDKLAEVFCEGIRTNRGFARGNPVNVPIAHCSTVDKFDDQFRLGDDAKTNLRRVQSMQSGLRKSGGLDSLVASGGACGPINVSYDQPVVGTDARPVRDALPRFNADRGGIATLSIPTLADLAGASAKWDDVNGHVVGASSEHTKRVKRITCEGVNESFVEAFTTILEFGNERAKWSPETVAAWIKLSLVDHARMAEIDLLTKIAAGSTAVTSGKLLGTTSDVVTTVDRALAGARSRYRLDPKFPMLLLAPFWLLSNMRTDLTRQIPEGTIDERMAAADSIIEGLFTKRGANVKWFLDGESGQIFDAQGPHAALNGWPSHVVMYLFPDGDWQFLDGGTLDLGLVRDSTLNGTNDVQLFTETWEGAHHHSSIESLRIDADICPDGSTSATVDIDPCTTGS